MALYSIRVVYGLSPCFISIINWSYLIHSRIATCLEHLEATHRMPIVEVNSYVAIA